MSWHQYKRSDLIDYTIPELERWLRATGFIDYDTYLNWTIGDEKSKVDWEVWAEKDGERVEVMILRNADLGRTTKQALVVLRAIEQTLSSMYYEGTTINTQ